MLACALAKRLAKEASRNEIGVLNTYDQTPGDLEEYLREQMGFLSASASSFDSGHLGEARRIAVVVRVLVHDTGKSKSLLSQLDKKHIRFWDTSNDLIPDNMMPFAGLVLMRLTAGEGMSYVAALDSYRPQALKSVSFQEWWEKIVIKDSKGATFSRKDLVLTSANKEGGAHVDPTLDRAYADLTRFDSMAWRIRVGGQVGPAENAPVLPSIRQIGYEVLKSLMDEYPDLEK